MKRKPEDSQTKDNKKQKNSPTNNHTLFWNNDLRGIMNSYRDEDKKTYANSVTSSIAGYFTPVVHYRGTGELHEGVEHLIFYRGVWSTLKLPKTLKKITFKSNTNLDRLGNLAALRKVDLVAYNLFIAKNRRTKNTLEEKFQKTYGWPPSVKTLKIKGGGFNHKITTLPGKLKVLTFGSRKYDGYNLGFNEKIDPGVLPQSLTHLKMGMYFNKPFEKGVLPNSLTHLSFGFYFNQPILFLPESLISLTLGYSYNQPFYKGVLRDSLTHLALGDSFNQPLHAGDLPQSLTHLILGFSYDQPFYKGVLRDSLTQLTVDYSFNQLLQPGDLPQSLTHLTMGYDFNQPFGKGVLRDSLTHLTVDYSFNQPLQPGDLPQSLTHLILGCCYNQPLYKGVLPESLTHLTFGEHFNQPIQNMLPEFLTHLTISSKCSYRLDSLPKSLQLIIRQDRDWDL